MFIFFDDTKKIILEETMLIIMKKIATKKQIQNIIIIAEEKNYKPHIISGKDKVSIAILNNNNEIINLSNFLGLDGIEEIIPITKSYKLVSREIKQDNTIVKIGNVCFGDNSMPVIAGPCAIESKQQALEIAEIVKKAGAVIFRGGLFKPRSSPYSFQGLGKNGLKILIKIRKETGLAIVTEAMDIENFNILEEYADAIQIGARNMQNFSLLKRAGKSLKPIILKRGMCATLQEWLMAAEYIINKGNNQIILCERGIRTFVKHSRNTLDLSVVNTAKQETHLPVIVDPSHAAGIRDQVIPLALASAAVRPDGLMIEVHNKPNEALSDGAQSLFPNQFKTLMKKAKAIYSLAGKTN